MAMRVAKKMGMVFDEKSPKVTTQTFPVFVKAIFEDGENEDHLFALKLALFEVEDIRDSKKAELKKKLRQSKTKRGVLRAALEIVSE